MENTGEVRRHFARERFNAVEIAIRAPDCPVFFPDKKETCVIFQPMIAGDCLGNGTPLHRSAKGVGQKIQGRTDFSLRIYMKCGKNQNRHKAGTRTTNEDEICFFGHGVVGPLSSGMPGKRCNRSHSANLKG